MRGIQTVTMTEIARQSGVSLKTVSRVVNHPEKVSKGTTDGNVMPILDLIVDCKPDAIHSLDPQSGVDLAEVKRLYGDKVCLITYWICLRLSERMSLALFSPTFPVRRIRKLQICSVWKELWGEGRESDQRG
ncbi:MAG TPA: LacI family DNA-binding transcriptional regulator [Candidatus Limivivens merdigallinarum]|uniref:LacI family DNA-binding transcriptional regulator n=1 Tax=Candidatus Limivivens merdigallinarum TaxID=2840859 RepID=A0A9D1D1A6_9FIRM|nr:LacI family DNA-binding transcriptional regulator [Candidatus Limivivens merdigallinarum]